MQRRILSYAKIRKVFKTVYKLSRYTGAETLNIFCTLKAFCPDSSFFQQEMTYISTPENNIILQEITGMKAIRLIIFLLFAIPFSGQAQFVDFGQDPASIRWKQIRTKNFQIIYPDFFEKNAQKVANIYTKLYNHTNTLRHKPGKISMILHANGGISNGNVGWAPKKSELYTTPPQEPSDTWLEHLCVHEFRHVVQIDKVNQGLTRGLYYIFGEIFPIAVVGVYLPMWFVEGDAVCFETAIGHLGRGRSPEFLNQMKAQIVEKGPYSYYKAVVGSYKDFVPNRYTMGYFMTANTRANYGPDVWANALAYTGRHPFSITPFARSLKKTMANQRDSLWNTPAFRTLFTNPDSVRKANTYKDAKRMLYSDNFSELGQIWKQEAAKITDKLDTIRTKNKFYANYYYPVATKDGHLIAYKDGLQQSGAFVLVGNNTKERTITRTGVLYDYKFDLKDSTLLWSEYKPNTRWEQGGRMILSSYDLRTGRYKSHKGKNNRFSPFAAGSDWGCVEVDNRNHSSLVLFDKELKKEKWRFTANRDELFIHPSWNDGKITVVVQTPQGIHIESIDTRTGTRTPLTKTMAYEMDNPVVVDSTLYFRASFNGNNAIYRSNGKFANILNAPFGVTSPSFSNAGDSLLFSFYTSNGYKPGKVKLSELKERPVEMKEYRLADTLKEQEDWQLKFDADSVYETRKYNKLAHLVNIHSWGPLDIGLNEKEVDLGLVVYSQNKLSTLFFTAGYVLNSGYDFGKWILQGSYKGWWPIIGFNLESGRQTYYSRAIITDGQTMESLSIRNRASLSSADMTIRFPFNISRKNYIRSIQGYTRYKIEALHNIRVKNIYTASGHTELDKDEFTFNTSAIYYQLLEYGLSFNNQTRMTEQEINPRWGQQLSAGFTHTPLKELDYGHQWWGEGRFYFPGLFRNHSISLYSGYQDMSDKNRYYSNKILNPRGISLYGYDIFSLRTAYHMPLFYPDKSLSSLLYFKGVYGGAFFDMGKQKGIGSERTFQSYGMELTTDTHILRLTFPVHMGVRAGYETQHKRMFANIIFSIGLSI